MKTTILTGVLTIMTIATCVQAADIPPPMSYYWTHAADTSVFTTPNGNGSALAACRRIDTPPGGTVDSTIYLHLLDGNGDPGAGVPAEDMWIETSLGGFVPCPNGSIADGPSDANGQATFSGVLSGGGQSDSEADERLIVFVMGSPIPDTGLRILVNSPDLNGDRQVDIDDLILFCQMYQSQEYNYAIDYYYDGEINLSDLILYAFNRNTYCN